VTAVVRRARPADAAVLARIQVAAWRAAYPGLLPDAYLHALREDELTAVKTRRLTRDGGRTPILVAEVDGVPAGFVVAGPGKAPDGPPDTGELYELDVDPGRWGTGLGRLLLAAARDELTRLGLRDAVLWVLPGNERARRLYEAAGWRDDQTQRPVLLGGANVPAMRYRLAL
jgi:ribosomal protein S18 acetylase RimI-like enzyme